MGNKNDCPDRKVVLYEDAKRFADQMNISLFETSAKDNINVEEVSVGCRGGASNGSCTALPYSVLTVSWRVGGRNLSEIVSSGAHEIEI